MFRLAFWSLGCMILCGPVAVSWRSPKLCKKSDLFNKNRLPRLWLKSRDGRKEDYPTILYYGSLQYVEFKIWNNFNSYSPRVPIVSLLHGLLKHPSVVLKLQGSGCFSLNMLGQLSQVVVSTSSRCTIAPARTTRWKSCITAYIDTNSKEKLSVRTSERVKRSTFMHGQKKYEILVWYINSKPVVTQTWMSVIGGFSYIWK